MSTFGFIGSTPADDAPLFVGQPYTFTIGIITDTAEGQSDEVLPFIVGAADYTLTSASDTIGDSTSGEATSATFEVTALKAGSITVSVTAEEGNLDLHLGSVFRTYTALVKPEHASPRRRLSGNPFPKSPVELFGATHRR
jgi:hypothetical protein